MVLLGAITAYPPERAGDRRRRAHDHLDFFEIFLTERYFIRTQAVLDMGRLSGPTMATSTAAFASVHAIASWLIVMSRWAPKIRSASTVATLPR
jgi:hypothetical protein